MYEKGFLDIDRLVRRVQVFTRETDGVLLEKNLETLSPLRIIAVNSLNNPLTVEYGFFQNTPAADCLWLSLDTLDFQLHVKYGTGSQEVWQNPAADPDVIEFPVRRTDDDDGRERVLA